MPNPPNFPFPCRMSPSLSNCRTKWATARPPFAQVPCASTSSSAGSGLGRHTNDVLAFDDVEPFILIVGPTANGNLRLRVRSTARRGHWPLPATPVERRPRSLPPATWPTSRRAVDFDEGGIQGRIERPAPMRNGVGRSDVFRVMEQLARAFASRLLCVRRG